MVFFSIHTIFRRVSNTCILRMYLQVFSCVFPRIQEYVRIRKNTGARHCAYSIISEYGKIHLYCKNTFKIRQNIWVRIHWNLGGNSTAPGNARFAPSVQRSPRARNSCRRAFLLRELRTRSLSFSVGTYRDVMQLGASTPSAMRLEGPEPRHELTLVYRQECPEIVRHSIKSRRTM